MNNQNSQSQILLQQSNKNGPMMQQRLKMRFLEQEKERLQVAVYELGQNLLLLRHINEQIIRGSFQKVNIKILQQNINLQNAYRRILEQNHQLSSQQFISKQIYSEQINQALEAVRNYQQKILSLRRSIQEKESHVQLLQTTAKYHSEPQSNPSTLPPYNISILFFQEIEDYKLTIKAISKQNQQLILINKNINEQIQQLKEQLQWIQNVIESNVSYYEFKQAYKKRKKTNSQLNIQLNVQKKKINIQDIINIEKGKYTYSQLYQLIPHNKQLSTLLVKQKIQFNQLNKKFKENQLKLKQSSQIISKLQISNQIYKNKLITAAQQIKYLQIHCNNLINSICHRKMPKTSKSHQKNQIHQFIEKIKKNKQQKFLLKSQKKQFWIEQQFRLKNRISNTIFKTKKRSLSCVNDYIFKQTIINEKKKDNEMIDSQNFSIMLQQYVQKNHQNSNSIQIDPFQFSAIKPAERITYADMRKNKNKKHQMNITKK